MDLGPQIFFLNISECLKDPEHGDHECYRLLDSFNRNLIEEQIDSALLDLYFPYFFHTSNSLLNFVDKSSKLKNFKRTCIKAVEILYTILNNFLYKLSEKDILSLYTLSSKISKSSIDSNIKVKFYDLVLRSLEKGDGCVENSAIPIYQDLYKSLILSLQMKNSDTVKSKELELTGYLSKKYSFLIGDPKQLRRIILSNFAMYCSVTQRKVSQPCICGFYTGFKHFLESFPLNLDAAEDKREIDKLYTNIKYLLVFNDRIKMGNRAALMFFATFPSYFKANLLKEYNYWHEKLLIWLTCGAEEKKVGVNGLRSFYQTLNSVLEESNDIKCKEIVLHFVNYCKTVFGTKEASNYEKRLAINCLREFASASHKHLESNEVTDLFLIIMQIFESTFIQDYRPDNEEWEFLPDYIQTVANFMKFKKFTASQFFCLQKGVISLIKSFHQLPYLHHGLIIDSLVLTLFYLKETQHFDAFLENIVYQGVVWSCSHQHLTAEAEASDETLEKIITVKNYYPLWRGILKMSFNLHYDIYGFHLEDRKYILKRVINELVKILMILINKLKVSVSPKEENLGVTEIEKAYQIDEVNDYGIFLNVIDFYEDIFDNIEEKMLESCITKLIDHLVYKCLKYPLISGFYKLLAFSLKISRDLALFSDNDSPQDIGNCRETLKTFLTTLLRKMSEFKDDLLISCLRVLLETPVEIIEYMLPSCVIPFTNIFEVGRSYLPLAELGVDTLEYWQENLKPEVIEPFLIKIIPGLDSFLRSKFLKGYSEKPMEKRRKTVQALKKRKVAEDFEPELIKLQKKMLCFIGRQNLKICQDFIFSDSTLISNLISGQSSHLKITLPYEDLQLDMYLDTFLPRIIELSLYSSDRKTRVVSCELLQACVMVFLGRAKPMSSAGLEDLNGMLQTIVMPLLQLGCDIDQVVRQIFEPLFLQLVHWYTSPIQTRSSHTMIIIEAMMDGITHPTNSNLRDFSGKCINEFIKWTLKHQNLSPDSNIKVLVKKMRFFSTHPDSSKKLGAALIFNSIYRELREEEKLVSMFWLEILHIFILSLDSVIDFEESSSVNEIRRSITHLQRVIIEKPSIFRKTDNKRRIPNDLNNGVLADLCLWLILQTASNNKQCREACMELFVNTAPLSTQTKLNLHEFVIEHLDMTVCSFYDSKLTRFHSLSQQSYCDCSSLLNYIRNLLCCLDGYTFIVKNNLETVTFKESIFIEAHNFLMTMQSSDIVSSLNSIEQKSCSFTTLDKDTFTKLKTACVLSLLKLYNAILHNEILCTKGDKLWSEHFWKLLTNVVFYPQDLSLTDLIYGDYNDVVVILLNTVPKKLAKISIQALQNFLQSSIKNHKISAIDIEKSTPLRQRSFLQGLFLLSNSSLAENLKLDEYANKLLEIFMTDFYKKANDNVIYVNQIHDTTFSYLSALFKFTLSDKANLETNIDIILCGEYYVQSLDMVKRKKVGLFFLSTFAEVIVSSFIKHIDTFLSLTISKSKENTTNLIIFMLGYVLKDKSYKKFYKDIANNLLIYWLEFSDFFNTNEETTALGIEFLSLFVHICDSGSLDIQDWLVDCLIKTQNAIHLDIFGLLAKITRNDITEKQSNDLKTAFTILNEKISNETGNHAVISSNFNKLLTFLPLVRSLDVFQYLIETYTKITSITIDIQNLLLNFMKQLEPNIQSMFLNKAFNMVTIQTASDILTTLFQNCDLEVFEQFFVDNIENILKRFEEKNLELGIIDFILVEILFLRIPIGSSERIDCPIIAASKKPKLLGTLLGYALNAFKLNKNQDELTRKYKCHAYNASASIISNSIKKLNFYEKLFTRQDNNIDLLWHGIVNTEIKYDFPREFDSLPAKRKILVNIRDELRQSRQQSGNISKTLRYIESQRLFNSSLSEDVTKFDFTNSILRTENEAERQRFHNVVQVQSEVYMEMTEINKHECMGTICSLVRHIFESGVSELPTEDDEDVSLPAWMGGIRELLLNKLTHTNVKIFLVKLIDNIIDIFSKFAKFFLEPLIQFVVDKIAGKTINYFVTDVIVIISKWATEIPDLSETESKLASKLLEHFIKNLKKDRQAIFKYNIEQLKLLVESWKNYLTPPVDTIFQMLSNPETIEIGIHVVSILLVNDIKVWKRGKELEFLNLMLKQLESDNRNIYRACSETLGPLLCILNSQEFVDVVDLKLIQSVTPLEKYVVCLEGIVIKFPQIVNMTHTARLITSLKQVPFNQKISHLKIINKRLEMSLDLLEQINEFKIVDWDEHIEDANLEIQILTLEIIKKCVLVFSDYPNFSKILRTITRNIYHPNPIFRACLYDAAISIYNLHKDENNQCKDMLIFGLVDTDLDNQNKIFEFWAQSSELPHKVIRRFSFLLSEMYKTKIEDKLLGFSTYFMLVLLNESDKYDWKIFEHPLEDCNFEEYKLQTNWKLQHPSVVPLFAETLNASSLESTLESAEDIFLLRTTQTNLEFAPTQSFQERQLSKLVSLESTLGVDFDPSFKDPNKVALSTKYKINHKRFLKDQSKISRNMAHYETHKKIKKAQERVESAIEKEKKVTIYRSYRKGDFPDIEIALSAILKPLQILALHDSEISQVLFTEIFKGLASKIGNNRDFLLTVSEAIKNIFSTSVQFNRYLLSALLDILLKNKENITLDASLIARVAQESGLVSLGALLIEEYIVSGMGDDGPSTSKRICGRDNKETVCWVKLAELYKYLEEWDTVRSIFLNKMDCKDTIQKALIFESKSMYREAKDLYENLIETDISENRRDFYYESYFNCFANLGKWDDIPKAIDLVIGNQNSWKGLWEDEWCKQKLLPWYIKSKIKTQLFTNELEKEFLENLNNYLMNPSQYEYLTSNYSEELCILWLCQNDIPTANQYLKISINNFLNDWQVLNTMFQSQRFQQLLKLHNVIEIADFTQIYKVLTDDIDISLKKLSRNWQRSKNDVTPSVLYSETKLLYRKQFINIVLEKLIKLEGLDLSREIKDLEVSKVRMDVDLINTAAELGGFYICRKYLRPYERLVNEKLEQAKGIIMVLKAHHIDDPLEKMNWLLKAVETFENLSDLNNSQALKSRSKLFDVFIEISKLASNNSQLLRECEQRLATSINKSINLASDIEKHAFNHLKQSAEYYNTDEMDVDTNDDEDLKKFKEVSNAYIKLAYFIRDKGDEELQADFMLFVLRAMRLNSSEARQMFPCILMNDNLGTTLKNLFITEVEKIPTWMFLGWIPQLLANVDSSKIFAISKIILKLAESYPQAIMYPYRLSKENYNFTDQNVTTEAKILTDRLDDLLLNDDKTNTFLKAMSFVSLPANILKYYLAKIAKSQNLDIVTKYVEEVQAEVFDQTCGTSNVTNLQGDMFKRIEKFKREFNKLKAKDMTIQKVKQICKVLNKEFYIMLNPDKRNKAPKHSYLLKEYSPWLANFSANKLNIDIEIPGQYDGQKMPLPQYHVKLSGFYPEIKIMDSLRKPIKISMLGMNTKEYPFLLKFGEDIRQDQRIEQLFSLMNEFLRGDNNCSNSGLDILTYQVIPLTSNLGMIQWINDTQPLKDFINKSWKIYTEKLDVQILSEYDRNLNIKDDNYFQHYGNAAVRIRKTKIVANYLTLVNKLPWDILRSSFWRLSTSTENVIALRNNFIKTYAVICAAHWILGIGDRHLGNSLISLRNGKVLGIDFGHAFGTGTQILPVPELVPFRLTPHLVNLMTPLNEKGPFREYMIHCLRCLRTNKASLLATMTVFIQEPSLDWLEHAGVTDDSQDADSGQNDSWYPVVKIQQARRKLSGANCVDIMLEELKDGTRNESYTEAYMKHVKGEPGENIRANFVAKGDLSVDDQVDCLLDHATDYNLLGRMWRGWNSWV